MDGALTRLAIIGTSCSGKTTLARTLANILNVPHIELDALHWQPNWTPRPIEEFRSLTRTTIAAERWVKPSIFNGLALFDMPELVAIIPVYYFILVKYL